MKLILKPNSNYSDLIEFRSTFVRSFLDFQFLSRKFAFSQIPKRITEQYFKKVFNFGSPNSMVEYPLRYERMVIEDILVPSPKSEDLANESFDLALALEILEHVANPEEELLKIHGLLCEGGYLLVTTPFLAREHKAPYDFYRWTEEGLNELIKKCGFEIIFSKKRGNILSVMGSFTNYAFYQLLKSPWFFLALLLTPVFLFFYFLGLISLWLSRNQKTTSVYLGVTVLARKELKPF
jgi:SAM-dependent methyltransferase